MPEAKFQIKRKCEVCGNTFIAKTLDSRYCCRPYRKVFLLKMCKFVAIRYNLEKNSYLCCINKLFV